MKINYKQIYKLSPMIARYLNDGYKIQLEYRPDKQEIYIGKLKVDKLKLIELNDEEGVK